MRGPMPFIVGTPRSGTSLLTQMLHAHPDFAIPPETYFIPDVVANCAAAADPRKAFLETVRSHRRYAIFKMDDDLLDKRIGMLHPFSSAGALRVFYATYAERFGKSRYGDKSPPYVENMLFIQDLIQEARFILMVRDGRDMALSIKDLSFGPNTIRDAAAWWVMVYWRARAQAEGVRHFLEIHYEDLVLNTEATMRRVCDFAELPWDPATLRYHEKFGERWEEIEQGTQPEQMNLLASPGRGFLNELLAKPPQVDRVAVWRREMSREDQDVFDEIAGDMLQALGYPLARDVRDADIDTTSESSV